MLELVTAQSRRKEKSMIMVSPGSRTQESAEVGSSKSIIMFTDPIFFNMAWVSPVPNSIDCSTDEIVNFLGVALMGIVY